MQTENKDSFTTVSITPPPNKLIVTTEGNEIKRYVMQTETEIRDIQLRTLSANGTNNGVFGFKDLETFIANEKTKWLSQLRKEIEGLREPTEDDSETTLYRHCEGGDHWKCSGDGEGGRCVCRCHALEKVLNLLQETK